MAKSYAGNTVETAKGFWRSQFQDEEKLAMNMKLLRAIGMFAGSIVIMRNFGDLMAI